MDFSSQIFLVMLKILKKSARRKSQFFLKQHILLLSGQYYIFKEVLLWNQHLSNFMSFSSDTSLDGTFQLSCYFRTTVVGFFLLPKPILKHRDFSKRKILDGPKWSWNADYPEDRNQITNITSSCPVGKKSVVLVHKSNASHWNPVSKMFWTIYPCRLLNSIVNFGITWEWFSTRQWSLQYQNP